MKSFCILPLLAFLLSCYVHFCGSRSGLAYASNPVFPPVNTNSLRASGPKEKLRVTFRLHGLPVYSQKPRAMHIHEYGDLSKGCGSTGGHYNPLSVNHPQHPGDFGNFVPVNGKIRQSLDSSATLFGRFSILGRSVVIHEGEDDLGRGGNVESLLNGNAGGRLACCVIGLANPQN
uniref:Superoxide dismutase [Cu-Zn] n=1 Tax=Cyprinus carpio carpio TaxID=630221 RepID=A0A8C0YIG9_CYPCA